MKKSEKLCDLSSRSGMKEATQTKTALFGLVLASLFLGIWMFFPQMVGADVEWKIIKDLDLKAKPLDIAPSVDGKWLFILASGEILIFSIPEGRITDQIPVDKEFDRIAPLMRPNLITVTSNTKKSLQVIWFEPIYKIDVAGLPFRGPQEAPVTIAVFDDYQ